MSGNDTIKLGFKSMGIDDTQASENGENKNPIQQMQIQTYDAVKQCGKLGHYGFYGNAPKGSLVVVMQVNGQEECLYGAEDDVNKRPRGLKEGEVMMYNTITESYIYLNEDENCEIYSKKDLNIKVEGSINITVANGDCNLTAGNTNVVGNVSVQGNLSVQGNTTVSGTMSAGVVEAGNGADLSGSDTVTSVKGIVTGA